MARTFLIADTHFGHVNILTFKRNDESPLRDFPDINLHDEYLVSRWNSVVGVNDKVYHLGDVGFKSFSNLSKILERLNGTKILIKGNHDGFKLSQYQQYFKDVRATHQLDKFILSHIPIHPESISRWKGNIHGHVHSNTLDDSRYINVSVENINYTPIDFEEIRSKFSDN